MKNFVSLLLALLFLTLGSFAAAPQPNRATEVNSIHMEHSTSQAFSQASTKLLKKKLKKWKRRKLLAKIVGLSGVFIMAAGLIAAILGATVFWSAGGMMAIFIGIGSMGTGGMLALLSLPLAHL